MPSYLIGGEKGGTGKSTVATNLATMLALSGYSVILINCDKQKNANTFVAKRLEREITPVYPHVQKRGKSLHAEIDTFANDYEYVIVDAGGQDSPEMRSALVAKSVIKVYTPIQASDFDLETLVDMAELVENAQYYNENLKAYILPNQFPTNPLIDIGIDAIEALKNFAGSSVLELSDVVMYERIPYVYAVNAALSVVEYEHKKIRDMTPSKARAYSPKASYEMCKLFSEVFENPFDYQGIFGAKLNLTKEDTEKA